MNTVPNVKPGVTTSEFWLTLIFAVVSLLTGLNVIGPDWSQAHKQLLDSMALLAATLAPGVYAIARAITKHGNAAAAATVVAAQVEAVAASVAPPVVPVTPPGSAFATPAAPVAPASDLGAGLIAVLVYIAALVLVLVGLLLVVIAAVHGHRLDVTGIVMIVIGVVLAVLGRFADGGVTL